GPGFMNLRLRPSVWCAELRDLLHAGERYGESSLGHGHSVNVEYVSANPTGPMHIGHCRGAVVGDALANLLIKAGYAVTKEYYINDAGNQANELARSAYNRYLEALGHPPYKETAYGGAYLIPVGKALAEKYGDSLVGKEEAQWLDEVRLFAVDAMMAMIRKDLDDLNIKMDVFTSERALVEAGKVQAAVQRLRDLGLIYQGILEAPKGKVIDDWEPREQTLFRSSQFGDDVDRPLMKSDGSWTYMAPDIAYHYDKYQRGSHLLVDILGADHGGYVKRISAAVKAISEGQAEVVVRLCQMVKFLDRGQVLKMSKRSGVFVTVADAIERVGRDALRFMMLTRKNDAPLEFDFQQVIEQTKDNPVFYVQYASARCFSVLRHAKEAFPDLDLSAQGFSSVEYGFEDDEVLSLIRHLAAWPRTVESAAESFEPHRIAYYLHELAAHFHALWNKGKEKTHLRFIDPEHRLQTQQNLGLVRAVLCVLTSGLEVLGVQPLEEMR
ncbi:MAG: arginine--tRNA ligase, partial [Holosporales bacterium]